ncbi:iron chelate uptake ABC transporter family permease subunit [Specibacter sp. NPDC078692]|uniref:iron chelate uptake ABC transporter family permease subunit n=1 Tax=Specibacter sp. NPDC078692 TaxID=3155818 RepID=UPI00341F9C8D
MSVALDSAGTQHGQLTPNSMLLGALLVSKADVLGHILIPPVQIPAGMMIDLIGGPYFLWLLRRSRG